MARTLRALLRSQKRPPITLLNCEQDARWTPINVLSGNPAPSFAPTTAPRASGRLVEQPATPKLADLIQKYQHFFSRERKRHYATFTVQAR
jgi:hypothetical protein